MAELEARRRAEAEAEATLQAKLAASKESQSILEHTREMLVPNELPSESAISPCHCSARCR